MLLVNCFVWWYNKGFAWVWNKTKNNLQAQADFYAVGSLVGTLFAPYRQIGTGARGRSLSDGFQAWLDRTISRFVGAAVRIILLLSGSVVIAVYAVYGVFTLVVWPFIPLLPVVGIVLALFKVGQ